MKYIALLLVCCCACSPKQIDIYKNSPQGNANLQSGPMLGYSEMKESLIWVQTKSESKVVVAYWVEGQPAQRWTTDVQTTQKSSGFTAKCIADQVEPGMVYQYEVIINGTAAKLPYPTTFKTQTLWQWRTDPPAFTVAAGSCAYVNEPPYDRPGKPYGSNYQIFTKINDQKPDLMLWLGDNVYYREVDWFTRTGMIHRNTQARSLPELQPLLASASHFAIWDDHDYGPNDSDGTFVHKDMAYEVFQNFWGNPSFGVQGRKGCTTMFQYNDVEFFLLDDRYFRTPNDCSECPNRSMLGKEQLDWMCGALAASRAPFKMVAVGGQVLTTSKSGETFSNLYPEERAYILDFIEKEKIKGVVFLTGDRHFTELSLVKNKAGISVYDLTASPFTSGTFADAATKELNDNRVEGTVVTVHNFATLHFSGPRKQRQLTIKVFDYEGKELWAKSISQE